MLGYKFPEHLFSTDSTNLLDSRCDHSHIWSHPKYSFGLPEITFYLLNPRYIGKRSIKRSDDFVYGGMEGLDVLTSTQRDMVLNQATIVPEPLLVTEELAYESQELKMDLFVDEIPEDEFISGEFVTLYLILMSITNSYFIYFTLSILVCKMTIE